MQIKHLQAFLTVVQEGSINKAAQALFIAQPPLSRQMHALEEDLGVQLFIRGSREIQLTGEGRILAERADEIINLVNNTRQEITDFQKKVGGILNIGSIPTASTLILPHIIDKYRQNYPNVQFKILEGASERIIGLLEKGIIDVAFIRPPFNEDLYASIELGTECLGIVFNRNYFPLTIGNSISVFDLRELPLLLLDKYTALIKRLYSQKNLTPYIFCQSDNIVPVLAWAKNGFGVGITPYSAYNSIYPDPALSFIPFSETELVSGRFMIFKRNRYLSNICQTFIEAVRRTK